MFSEMTPHKVNSMQCVESFSEYMNVYFVLIRKIGEIPLFVTINIDQIFPYVMSRKQRIS